MLGCSNGWDGLWLVIFDDPKDISGDCVNRDTGWYDRDTGESDRYYEERSGDEWSVVEIEVKKGVGTVVIPEYHSVLERYDSDVGMFHGEATKDQIKGEYKTSRKQGRRQTSYSNSYREERSNTNHQILINRNGTSIDGEIRLSREYDEVSGWADGSGYDEEGYEWDCTTRTKFEGSRDNKDD